MREISAKELKEQLDTKKQLQIIDIREEYEFEDGALSDVNIPLGDFLDHLDKISSDEDVVVYCQSGKRASALVYTLKERFDRDNFLNLSGGYEAFIALQ